MHTVFQHQSLHQYPLPFTTLQIFLVSTYNRQLFSFSHYGLQCYSWCDFMNTTLQIFNITPLLHSSLFLSALSYCSPFYLSPSPTVASFLLKTNFMFFVSITFKHLLFSYYVSLYSAYE